MNDSLKPKSSNKYKFDIKRPTTFYGLPSVVKFCKKCTYSNQKPISEKERLKRKKKRKMQKQSKKKSRK